MFQCSFGKWMDISEYYKSLNIRYVQSSSTVYGIVLSGDFDYDYLWTVANGYGTAIPPGWLIALYLRNNAPCTLIVPSRWDIQLHNNMSILISMISGSSAKS